MPTTGRQLTQDLAKLALRMRRDIEASASGFDQTPAVVAARRKSATGDFRFFATTYFPHYFTYDPSVMHEWLFSRLQGVGDGGKSGASRSGARLVVAAPRGEAKSTITSKIFVLWCALTGRRHYIPILADAFDQAATLLVAIKTELESNSRLQLDFPEGTGEGRVWQEGVIVTRNNIKIQAFGSGKRMRGLSHGPHRPDLVICDDLENDESVRSPEQRDKLEGWLTRSVLSLGNADDSMDVVVIGTILHYDSVLSRLLRNPLWQGKIFRAVLQWPHRMELWDRWEELLRNQGRDFANSYYHAQRAAMDEGAVLSWPAARTLLGLMEKRVRDGRQAFDSEQQNDPVSSQDGTFGEITQWLTLPAHLIYVGALDPSLGRHGNSRDPSALLVGGWDRQSGVLYVVEALIARRLPDLIIEEVIRLQRRYRCLGWVVESVQFQDFMRTELIKRSIAAGAPVSARPVTPNADKLLRIQSLQPYIKDGRIRFHPTQVTLLEQLRHFPRADHDDGPDALEMLWNEAQRAAGWSGGVMGTGVSNSGMGGGRMTTSETGFGTVGQRDFMRGYGG